ncbi:MAG: Fic family protein [Candidatus Babeliales bacterium]
MLEALLKKIDALKNEIGALRPLSTMELASLRNYFKIGLTYTSNALEGNSLTETETKVVIEDGLTVGGKPLVHHLEAVGAAQAYDYMYELASKKNITALDICELHRIFYKGIDSDQAGVYRNQQVYISGTEFVPPVAAHVGDLMKQLEKDLLMWQKELHPVLYAAKLHAEFVTIHPFIDGNGRTARLVMNLALLQHGYAVTIIPPILRNQYIAALKQAQCNKNEKPFFEFIASMVYESQRDYKRLFSHS